MTIQCCRCGKDRKNGQWPHVSVPLAGRVSHSYCPECSDALLVEIRQERIRATPISRPLFEGT
jgi:hypothetical protein